MPTLIRLVIVLVVLAALALAGMVALTIFVQPGEKEIRVPIPPQQLGVTASNDPLGIRPQAPAATPPATTTTRTVEPLPPGTTEVDIPE